MTLHCSQTAGIERGWREGNSCPSASAKPTAEGVSLLTFCLVVLMLQHQVGFNDLQFTVSVSCLVCHLHRKWFSQTDTLPPYFYAGLFTLTGFANSRGLGNQIFSVSIPAVWRAEFAWTGALSPVQRGKRCNGARTTIPWGSERTPSAGSPAVSSSRCCPC